MRYIIQILSYSILYAKKKGAILLFYTNTIAQYLYLFTGNNKPSKKDRCQNY